MQQKITYNQLLAMGIPKPTLHGVLHKLVLAQSYSTKPTNQPITTQTSANTIEKKEKQH